MHIDIKVMIKIITSLFIVFFTASVTYGQGVRYRGDSMPVQKKPGSEQVVEKQSPEGRLRNQPDEKNNGVNHPVKKISQGARPDMTRARGARPPHVVRQAGAGIPRGLGKPGGAFRRVGR